MSRLSEARVQELYSGALRLVAERGYENVTMDHIAEATRSSKATLYRQWGSKLALFIEALTSGSPVPETAPDTGSLRGDLGEMFAQDHEDVDWPPELVGTILQAMKQNEELDAAVRAQLIDPVHDRINLFVQRAVDRGEVAAECPAIPHLQLALLAPFVLSATLTGADYESAQVLDYLDGLILPALGIH